MTIVGFCMLTATPHFLYGPGKDALALTTEFGGVANENVTQDVLEKQRAKELCRDRSNETACALEEGNFAPQAVLFLAQVVSGIGGGLYYTLGVSYMDDNTKKSKTPALLSKCAKFLLLFIADVAVQSRSANENSHEMYYLLAVYRCHKAR